MQPNFFGIFLFVITPLIINWAFKKYSLEKALFLSIAIPYLVLPAGYTVDFPLLPPLNRNTLSITAIMVVLFINKVKNPIFKFDAWSLFFIGYLITITISTLLNQDNLEFDGVPLNASKPYDVISNILQFLLVIMPLIFGKNLLSNPKNNELMFKTLTIIALVYSVPMLLEVRVSPQLHNMIYGYEPGMFLQNMRAGGFRPIVLVGHGLSLAYWFSIAMIAALALYKTNVKVTRFFGFKTILYFIIVLILSKTVSALVYFAFAAIIMYSFKFRKQILITCLVPVFVMLYPLNSTSQYVKNDDIIDFVESYSEDRAQSLEFRFNNEEMLIGRALQRPFFGWSGWGRQRVYSMGKDISVTDGLWILQIGSYGAVGFVFYYLMLFTPLFLALKNYKYIKDEKQQVYFTTLAIILAIGIFDSVPNKGMAPVHFLMAGSLLGQAIFYRKQHLQSRLKKIQNFTDN